jgi:Domain of unknown function (DUF4160)
MPTLLRIRGFKVFFFSEEGSEPVHVHVRRGDGVAKFWLEPVKLVFNDGFKKQELLAIVKILEKHEKELIRKWHEID